MSFVNMSALTTCSIIGVTGVLLGGLHKRHPFQGERVAADLPTAITVQKVISKTTFFQKIQSLQPRSLIGKIALGVTILASLYAIRLTVPFVLQWANPKTNTRTQEDLSEQIQHQSANIESSFKQLNKDFDAQLQNDSSLLENAQISIAQKLEESKKLQKALKDIPEENLAFVLEDLEKDLVDIFTNNEGRFDAFMTDLQKQEEIERTIAEAMASIENSEQELQAVTHEIADLATKISELSFE